MVVTTTITEFIYGLSILLLWVLLISAVVGVYVSVVSCIPAAAGHITGRLWRKRRARHAGIALTTLDAESSTRPTFLLYVYALIASVLTTTFLYFIWTMGTIVLIESGEVIEPLEELGEAINGSLARGIITMTSLLVVWIATFTVAFMSANRRIPKRRRDRAIAALNSTQSSR